jgi:hypothetical protein
MDSQLELKRLLEILSASPEDDGAANALFYCLLRRRFSTSPTKITNAEIDMIFPAFEAAVINITDPTREENFHQFMEIYSKTDNPTLETITARYSALCKLAVNEIIEDMFNNSIEDIMSRFMERVQRPLP